MMDHPRGRREAHPARHGGAGALDGEADAPLRDGPGAARPAHRSQGERETRLALPRRGAAGDARPHRGGGHPARGPPAGAHRVRRDRDRAGRVPGTGQGHGRLGGAGVPGVRGRPVRAERAGPRGRARRAAHPRAETAGRGGLRPGHHRQPGGQAAAGHLLAGHEVHRRPARVRAGLDESVDRGHHHGPGDLAARRRRGQGVNSRPGNPWGALSALCIGFFMILLDATIVSIAIPAMLLGLNASLNSVVWVTSVYLLTYAVPMLFTSRLGDRFGPKRIFLAGLVIFTGASLWCGLAGDVGTLIAARGVQGLGAALMTPQTLAFITFLFPPARRGAAMGLWGGIAGMATVTGPLLGGLLVDNLGWQWIFFVNVPVGVV